MAGKITNFIWTRAVKEWHLETLTSSYKNSLTPRFNMDVTCLDMAVILWFVACGQQSNLAYLGKTCWDYYFAEEKTEINQDKLQNRIKMDTSLV